MKKYFVLCVYSTEWITPNVLFQTENMEDAMNYAAIMNRNESKYNHIVVSNL